MPISRALVVIGIVLTQCVLMAIYTCLTGSDVVYLQIVKYLLCCASRVLVFFSCDADVLTYQLFLACFS